MLPSLLLSKRQIFFLSSIVSCIYFFCATNLHAQCPASVTVTNTGPYTTGATINLNATASNASKFSWSGPNSFTSTLQNPTIASSTPAMSGTYNVTVTEALGPEVIAGGQFTTGTTIPATMITSYTNTTGGNTNGGYYVQADAGTNNYGNSGCVSGAPSAGGFFVANGANVATTTALEQTTIAVTSGKTYRFSIWVGNVFTSANTPIIDVYVNGVKQTTLTFASGCNWQNYTYDFIAASANATFKLVDTKTSGLGLGDVFGIDDVSVREVFVCSVVGSTAVSVMNPPAPGGIATGNMLWLKANTEVYSDAGVTAAANGGTVQQWSTQVGTDDATQTTAADKPLFYTGAATQGMNFNPALSFVSNDELHFPTNIGVTGTNAFTIIAVTKQTATGRLFGALSTANGGVNKSYEMNVASTIAAYATQNNIANANNVSTDNIPHIAATYRSGNTFGASANAATASTAINTVSFNNPQAYDLGSSYNNAPYFSGALSEFIIFNTALSTANLNQVSTYLALKYGITLDQVTAQNYTGADGTTVFWDGTTNNTYKNNIAGIARDDASALNQKQSKSVNAGLQPVIGNENTIATDNIANASTFSVDKSALVWGDNAGSVAAWTATGAPSGNRQIVARTWKTQETGTVGSVKVQIADNSGTNGLPAEVGTVYLLTDANGDFTAGATQTAMTLNGTNWEATIDLTTAQFFTFATKLTLCEAGTAAPTLSAITKVNNCPAATVDLTAIASTNLPSSTTLTWHNATPASTANKLTPTQAQTAPAGTYYAAFFDAVNTCYSGVSGNGAATTTTTAIVNGCTVALSLTKTGDKTTVTPGQNIIYTLTLTNASATTATNVKVQDQLPAGVTFVSATPSSGTYNAITGLWTLPSVATGSQTLTITVTAQ
jgi:uncharacterized repeat protein (TIGR01451 family)